MSGGSRRLAGLVSATLAALALRSSGVVTHRGAEADAPSRFGDGPGHETRDVNVRNTVLVMGGLVLTVAMVIGGMALLMNVTAARQRAALPALTPQQTARLQPPPPNLQADPYADLDRDRARERAALDSYGYLDPGRRRAHIPIDRAMQLTVGRSLDGGETAR